MKKRYIIGGIILLIVVLGLWGYWKSNYFCCGGPSSVADMSIEEIREIFEAHERDSFWERKKIETYPSNKVVDIKLGEVDGFAISIRNLLRKGDSSVLSYNISAFDVNVVSCGVDKREMESWITIGREEVMNVAPGEDFITKVLIAAPEDQPPCTFRWYINVYSDGVPYATDYFDTTILP